MLRSRNWRCPSLLSPLHPSLHLLHCAGNIGQQLHTTARHYNVILDTNLNAVCVMYDIVLLHVEVKQFSVNNEA
jgi:hypothetical protein